MLAMVVGENPALASTRGHGLRGLGLRAELTTSVGDSEPVDPAARAQRSGRTSEVEGDDDRGVVGAWFALACIGVVFD